MTDYLNKDWVTDGIIDFEYKKYVLLAYLQRVKARFDAYQLYPQLSDLVEHFQYLHALKQGKESLSELFPKQVTGVDFEKVRLTYARMIEDDELMQEIKLIVDFALPQVEAQLKHGKTIYEWIEQQVEFITIGIAPLYKDEGYLFIEETMKPNYHVYQYQVTLFQQHQERYRGVYTQFLGTYRKSISQTAESMKLTLVKEKPQLPNPATYLIAAKTSLPLADTLLPVAKRMLIRHLSLEH
jgi:hypothetical protein